MEEIIQLLSTKYNLSKTAVQAITLSCTKFISESVRKEEMKNFNIPHLGKIVIKKAYEGKMTEELQKYKEAKEKYRLRNEGKRKGNTDRME